LLAGVVLVLGVAVVLDRDDTHPATAQLTESDVARIAKRVERLRGLRFERPVRPLFLDRDEALELAREIARADYPQRERRVDEEGLKLLGLLRPSADLRDVIETVNEEQLLGFYDDRSKRLVVIRDPGVTRPLLEITLAHELVHALEDQHFGLRVPEGVPDDSVLAEAALAEGTATSLMADYAKRFLSLGDVVELARLPGGEDLPPFIERLLLFPYLEGEKFVATFRGEEGDWKPIDAIYRLRRPRSSEQILHPRKYALDERPERLAAADLQQSLGAEWQSVRSTALGEYDVRLLIDLGGGTRPGAGAQGWAGGRYELWRKGVLGEGCPAPCVARDVALVRVRWESRRDRAEAEAQLARVFAKSLRGREVEDGRGVRLWSSRGGAIAMRGGGKGTTVVLAPDARLVARLLSSVRGHGPDR
jgi:hypothetical protein